MTKILFDKFTMFNDDMRKNTDLWGGKGENKKIMARNTEEYRKLLRQSQWPVWFSILIILSNNVYLGIKAEFFTNPIW